MYQYIVAARSKLKNFAPKILLCAQLIVLSIRNANIVRQTNRQTGIYQRDSVRQGFDKNLSPHTAYGRKSDRICAHKRKNKKNTRLHSSGGLPSIYLVITSSCNLVFFFVFSVCAFRERRKPLIHLWHIWA